MFDINEYLKMITGPYQLGETKNFRHDKNSISWKNYDRLYQIKGKDVWVQKARLYSGSARAQEVIRWALQWRKNVCSYQEPYFWWL